MMMVATMSAIYQNHCDGVICIGEVIGHRRAFTQWVGGVDVSQGRTILSEGGKSDEKVIAFPQSR
jgi:hypothetical protein